MTINEKEIINSIIKLGCHEYEKQWIDKNQGICGLDPENIEIFKRKLVNNWLNPIKLFIGNYVFQRQGASRLYPIIAVQVIEEKLNNFNFNNTNEKDIRKIGSELYKEFKKKCKLLLLNVWTIRNKEIYEELFYDILKICNESKDNNIISFFKDKNEEKTISLSKAKKIFHQK